MTASIFQLDSRLTDLENRLDTSDSSFDDLYDSLNTYGQTLPWNVPWGARDSAQVTVDQNGVTNTTTDVTDFVAQWTGVANRLYRVKFFFRGVPGGALNFIPSIVTGTSGTGTTIWSDNFVAVGSGVPQAIEGETFYTGSGALSLHLRLRSSSGTANVDVDNGTQTGWFVVEDVGPTGAPA